MHKNIIYCLLPALLALNIVTTSSLAETPPKLVIATEDYPPYEMIEPVEGLQGFDYEVMVAAFSLLGYELDVQFLPWKRVLNYTQRGLVAGILTCAHHKEREEFIRFSDPISEFTNGFYVRKNFDGPKPDLIEDVAGQKVASISGYESLAVLEDMGMNPMDVPNTESAIKMLDLGRFDYLYVAKQATDFAIKRLGLQDKFEFYPISKQNFYFCFSKPYEGSEALLDEFNKALFILKKNGTYDRIHAKYR